jgi:hypothetical protein
LASDAATIESEGGGFMKPGEKRKRGRPKKTDAGPGSKALNPGGPVSGGPSDGPRIDPITELLPLTKTTTMLYSNILEMYAEDPRARPDQNTQDALSQAQAACLVQYFPNSFGQHASLILLATIVGSTGFNAWVLRRENLAKMIAEKKAKMNGVGETPEKVWS